MPSALSVLPRSLCLLVAARADTDGRLVADFMHRRYHETYKARLTELMPWLFGYLNEEGVLSSATGLRPAASEPLFLEQYLESRSEDVLTAAGYPVRRSALVEVGNFCSNSPGGARLLITGLAAFLHAAGFEWAVFTATRRLRNSFFRLGAPLIDLCAADPARLPGGGTDWGTYYEMDPRVGAMPLAALCQVLKPQVLKSRVADPCLLHLWQQAEASGAAWRERRMP